jgi:hypothetical protein
VFSKGIFQIPCAGGGNKVCITLQGLIALAERPWSVEPKQEGLYIIFVICNKPERPPPEAARRAGIYLLCFHLR